MLRTIVKGVRWTGVVLRVVPVERFGWTVLWFERVSRIVVVRRAMVG
jgi:hypothetical protein